MDKIMCRTQGNVKGCASGICCTGIVYVLCNTIFRENLSLQHGAYKQALVNVVIAMIDITPYKDLIFGNKSHVIRYRKQGSRSNQAM